MKNAVVLKINVFNNGDLSLSLGNFNKDNTPTALYHIPIEHYIDLFNKSHVYVSNKSFYGQSIEVYLSYYSNKYLFSNQHGRNKDGQCYSFNGYEDSKESLTIYDRPTIHLTYGNIYQEQKEPYKRYARFMDSSIWNYYVPILLKNKYAPHFSDNRYDFSPLKHAILSILNNYTYCIRDKKKYNLYQLRVAREYAHLFSRIVNQSFLPDISGHGKDVSPYLFHSERKSSEDLKKKEHIDILSKIKQYKWRFLLVDDHSTTEMAVVYEETATLTKLDVVKHELEKLFKSITIDTETDNESFIATENDDEFTKKNATIYIECASSIKAAKDKLEKKKYEIILLDYLLGEKDSGREYGYELLDWIYKQEKARKEDNDAKLDYKKGPDNRFYFMFISAFTTAVSERLLTEGWLRSEDYWYIGEGACPVNTPYLFQYRLLHIMEKRMKDMGLSKMLYVNRNYFEKSYIKTNIIDVIYAPNDKNVRQSANEHFNDILSLLYNYKTLLVDTHNTSNPFESPESTLATDIVMKNAYIGGFLEHLTQLVYLTAFGTVRQWPEMWEEYQFLKSVVGRIEVIEKYIFDLKNNSI